MVDLHAKIKDGSVILTDGKFPKEAAELFRKHGVEQPHTYTPDEDGEDVDKEIMKPQTWSLADKARPRLSTAARVLRG